MHRLERIAHRDRCVGEDLGQDRLSASDERSSRDDPVDEADAPGLVRVDGLAGEDQLKSAAPAHQSRQALGAAAAGKKAQLDLRLAKVSVLGGDADRAGHRGLAAAAEGEAVDRGDHRLSKGLDQVQHVLA